MKILVLCDQGVNRSATLAFRLKYLGHDVLTAGIKTNDPVTIGMLCEWAGRIIITEDFQQGYLHHRWDYKIELWDIGPDVYHDHHFDKKLLKVVDRLIAAHRDSL